MEPPRRESLSASIQHFLHGALGDDAPELTPFSPQPDPRLTEKLAKALCKAPSAEAPARPGDMTRPVNRCECCDADAPLYRFASRVLLPHPSVKLELTNEVVADEESSVGQYTNYVAEDWVTVRLHLRRDYGCYTVAVCRFCKDLSRVGGSYLNNCAAQLAAVRRATGLPVQVARKMLPP